MHRWAFLLKPTGRHANPARMDSGGLDSAGSHRRSVSWAFVLSSFRPMTVLNGLRSQSRSTDFVRQALVTVQFAILIGLLIVVGVMWQQRRFATTEALRVLTDQMLVIRSVCSAPLVTGLRALPGVHGVACSGAHLTGEQEWMTEFVTPDGREHALRIGATEFQVLDLLAAPACGRVAARSAEGFIGWRQSVRSRATRTQRERR